MANGVEIIVDERSADSRDVASYILVAIGRDCTVRVRGIKLDCETPPKHLTVLEAANMPAVLIEAGFISHASDLDYVLDHGREIAQAVADGVEAWSQNEVAI
jgi:N-acetylmuramoyl-L-alanine amidase